MNPRTPTDVVLRRAAEACAEADPKGQPAWRILVERYGTEVSTAKHQIRRYRKHSGVKNPRTRSPEVPGGERHQRVAELVKEADASGTNRIIALEAEWPGRSHNTLARWIVEARDALGSSALPGTKGPGRSIDVDDDTLVALAQQADDARISRISHIVANVGIGTSTAGKHLSRLRRAGRIGDTKRHNTSGRPAGRPTRTPGPRPRGGATGGFGRAINDKPDADRRYIPMPATDGPELVRWAIQQAQLSGTTAIRYLADLLEITPGEAKARIRQVRAARIRQARAATDTAA